MNDGWFPFFEDTLNDHTAQGLPDDLFKIWVNLLCLASQHDGLIEPDTLPFYLRISPEKASYAIESLVDLGFIEPVEHGFQPHSWKRIKLYSDYR